MIPVTKDWAVEHMRTCDLMHSKRQQSRLYHIRILYGYVAHLEERTHTHTHSLHLFEEQRRERESEIERVCVRNQPNFSFSVYMDCYSVVLLVVSV